jgi:DNA-binding NarL/FixJ family response regulator
VIVENSALVRFDAPVQDEDAAGQRGVANAATSLLIIDDLFVVREGIKHILCGMPIEVVGEFAQPVEALETIRARQPDVILVGGSSPQSGARDLPLLAAVAGRSRLLLYRSDMSTSELSQASGLGVAGFLPKTATVAELVEAVQSLAARTRYVHRSYVAPLLQLAGGKPASDRLTARERHVLELICEGHSNQRIATELGLTVGTTKVYVSRILSKLGVCDRTQAVVQAMRTRLVPVPASR